MEITASDPRLTLLQVSVQTLYETVTLNVDYHMLEVLPYLVSFQTRFDRRMNP